LFLKILELLAHCLEYNVWLALQISHQTGKKCPDELCNLLVDAMQHKYIANQNTAKQGGDLTGSQKALAWPTNQ